MGGEKNQILFVVTEFLDPPPTSPGPRILEQQASMNRSIPPRNGFGAHAREEGFSANADRGWRAKLSSQN